MLEIAIKEWDKMGKLGDQFSNQTQKDVCTCNCISVILSMCFLLFKNHHINVELKL